jgi:hypothetical protein
MTKNNNNTKSTKVRNTLCLAAVSVLAGALTAQGAFSPPSVDHCTASALSNNYNAPADARIISSTAQQAHNIPQHDPLSTDGIALNNDDADLSEFLGLTLPQIQHESSTSLAETPLAGSTKSEEQREFEMALGRAMDTLRTDYPDMLTKTPDFSIFDENLEVVDPTGVTLHSLASYRTSFKFLHMIINFFYCPEESGLTFRIVYDCARKNIRISWNSVLTPRSIYGGIKNKIHVDGISVYEFDRQTGLINRHRVEHLLLNDAPVQAPQGVFHAIAVEAKAGLIGPDTEGIPVFIDGRNNVFEFRGNSDDLFGNLMGKTSPSSSSLFSTSTTTPNGDDQDQPLFDQEAFDNKNKSRLRFGLPPITPDEFVRIEAETRALESAQRQKAATISANEMAKPKPKGNMMGKLFGNLLENSCESNYDCEQPEVCCDLGIKKICCSSGMRIFDGAPQQLQKIPLRVIADDGDYPQQGGPGGMDNYY